MAYRLEARARPAQAMVWLSPVLAAVLSVVWMSYAVKHEREQRDFSAPLPSSAPTR